MKPSKPLDQWQLQLIKYFKSNQTQMTSVCLDIWRERCALPKDYDATGCIQYLVGDLLKVIISMHEENTMGFSTGDIMQQLIFDAQPEQQWKFHRGANLHQTMNTSYWENWLWVIASRLRLTEVKYLTDFPSDLSPKSK